MKEYKQENYQQNKDKIKKRDSQPFCCECGSTCRHAGKAEHFRSIKHQTYLKQV